MPSDLLQPAETSRTTAGAPLHAIVNRAKRGPWVQLFSLSGFEWNRVTIPIARLPEIFAGLRILHLTDLHLRPRWQNALDQLLGRIEANPPDLVVISGDLLEHRFNQIASLPVLDRFLRALRSRLGTFAILGNHDGDLLGPQVTRAGAVLINDRVCTLRDSGAGASIELIGVPGVQRTDVRDSLRFRASAQNALAARSDNTLRIIVTHYPDTIRELGHLGADIFLAGHTHGGQVCLPGGFPIIRHDTLPRHFSSGVHRVGDTWLVVGRGFGFATHQVRLFCPSEVMEIDLAPVAPQGISAPSR